MRVLLKGISDLDKLRLAPGTADDLHADRHADGRVLIRRKARGNRDGGETGGGAQHAVALLLVGADQLSIRAFREKLHTERER